ncbi:hypothetical protein VNI00_004733 [Paramarasmius palmivorus]|uniref:Uncharacterized protein n=1 Tax=Paramarasmius palmivorus TaxID=297713 RepID=A0AAW0DIZ4_9AGAR
MPASKSCHPSLPPEFLEQLEADPNLLTNKSHVFDSRQEQFRRDVRKDTQDRLSVEIEVVRDTNSGGSRTIQNSSQLCYPPSFRRIQGLVDNMSGFQAGDEKTMLHMAACDGDVALAIRDDSYGIDIDRKDKNGVTALLLSLAKLVSLPRLPTLVLTTLIPLINLTTTNQHVLSAIDLQGMEYDAGEKVAKVWMGKRSLGLDLAL